jgi:O-succinylbenzoate synthase
LILRVEAAELRLVRMRLKSPFVTSFGVEHERECLLLRLDAEGIAGWGECVAGREPGYSYETTSTAWHILADHLIPDVLHRTLDFPLGIGEPARGVRGHPLAKAALELALWDLAGKAQGLSLARMLGASRPAVPVGVSVGIQPDVSALLRVVAEYVDAGYRRVKLKIRPGRDLEEARAVRKGYPGLALQVDANAAYDLQAARAFRQLDDLELLLIEQPLEQDDLLGHAQVQSWLRTPICLDESIGSARLAELALHLDACRAVNIKPARVGGLREAVAVHDLCRRRGVPVWCGGMLETGVGRAANLALAALPGFGLPGDISATDRYYDEDVADPPFRLNPDSTIDVPTGPGLGVEIVPQALEKFSVRVERWRRG